MSPSNLFPNSWLLSEHPMFLRTAFEPYQERAEIFIREVVSKVVDMQFYTANGQIGGPIIMTQVIKLLF